MSEPKTSLDKNTDNRIFSEFQQNDCNHHLSTLNLNLRLKYDFMEFFTICVLTELWFENYVIIKKITKFSVMIITSV